MSTCVIQLMAICAPTMRTWIDILLQVGISNWRNMSQCSNTAGCKFNPIELIFKFYLLSINLK